MTDDPKVLIAEAREICQKRLEPYFEEQARIWGDDKSDEVGADPSILVTAILTIRRLADALERATNQIEEFEDEAQHAAWERDLLD